MTLNNAAPLGLMLVLLCFMQTTAQITFSEVMYDKVYKHMLLL